MTDQEFINIYCDFCIENDIKIKSVGIAQAMIETGHFKDKLSRDYNNYYGIKFHSSDYVKNGVNLETQEFIDGNYENTQAYFSVYDSKEDCFKDYADIVEASRWLTKYDYISHLQAMGYATSPDYINLVNQVIEDYNLTEYDTPVLFDEDLYNFMSSRTQYEFNLNKMAHKVINGEYGNGEERKNKLGDSYDVIQDRVNEILS